MLCTIYIYIRERERLLSKCTLRIRQFGSGGFRWSMLFSAMISGGPVAFRVEEGAMDVGCALATGRVSGERHRL